MRIKVISSKEEIAGLNPKERVVHLTTHPTTIFLLELIKRCPHLEAVQAPPSKFRKVSKPSRGLLEVQGVEIFPGVIQGHRTDRYAYYTVDDGLILQSAGELQAEGLHSEEVVERVAIDVKVSPGMAKFIIVGEVVSVDV